MPTAIVHPPVYRPRQSHDKSNSACTLRDQDVQPKFDPGRHLRYQPPAERHTFGEFGLDSEKTQTDMCITDPFDLFTEDCVRLMRRELFQPVVFNNYMHSWARAPCVIRGIAPTVSSFSPAFVYLEASTDDMVLPRWASLFTKHGRIPRRWRPSPTPRG